MKIGWIALGIALLVMVLSQGQAKDYKERIGQYEVNFTLPDEVASTIEVNKTITSGEELDGIPYDKYVINLQISETDQLQGWLWITHFNATWEMDLAGSIEGAEEDCKGEGYNNFRSALRTIDRHEGYIVDCSGSILYLEKYRFAYQLDDRTTVAGVFHLDWDTAMVPFLKSLHVKEVP